MVLCFHRPFTGLPIPEPHTCSIEAVGRVEWARGCSPRAKGWSPSCSNRDGSRMRLLVLFVWVLSMSVCAVLCGWHICAHIYVCINVVHACLCVCILGILAVGRELQQPCLSWAAKFTPASTQGYMKVSTIASQQVWRHLLSQASAGSQGWAAKAFSKS